MKTLKAYITKYLFLLFSILLILEFIIPRSWSYTYNLNTSIGWSEEYRQLIWQVFLASLISFILVYTYKSFKKQRLAPLPSMLHVLSIVCFMVFSRLFLQNPDILFLIPIWIIFIWNLLKSNKS